MDKEQVRLALPEQPRDGMIDWTIKKCREDAYDLGKDYLVWSPEWVDMREFIFHEWFNPDDCGGKPKKIRMARCKCHVCGSVCYTELENGRLSFILGECGEFWPTMAGSPYDMMEGYPGEETIELENGESLECPGCGWNVELIRASALKGGRTKQILVSSIERVGGYTAVVYWLVSRHITETGCSSGAVPRDAYVLDERGRITRYTHKNGGGAFYAEKDAGAWRVTTNTRDSIHMQYHDWGSINNRKVGGYFWDDVPDLDDTTGEKTGMEAYAKAGGEYYLDYLKLWRRNPQVENLVNTGWVKLVEDFVGHGVIGYNPGPNMEGCMDMAARKPHEMLGLTRQEMKEIRRRRGQWNYEQQRLFRQYIEAGLQREPFDLLLKEFRTEGIRNLIRMQKDYKDADLLRVRNYMRKQQMHMYELGILMDTRDAQRAVQNGPLTQEQLWPRNLIAVHDRLTIVRSVQVDPEKAAEYAQGFAEVLEDYRGLEWTDGDLCIRLPRVYAELVAEGTTLKHCVGGYGEAHISRRDVIFFVRKYRRPERSYYTLDIRMKGTPEEVQLHGYGNERHGPNKKYTHKIPKRVRDFCDRWEKEVLMPWYEEQKKGSKTA